MISRNYPKIKKFLKHNQSLLVLGPRGCGKTYFLSRELEQFKNTISIDLLDKINFERYLREPEILGKEIQARLAKDEKQPLLVFVDEIQRIPSLLNEVHRLIELCKPKLHFLLTGSSARKLKDQEANLLAGRALRENFFPLGVDEIDYQENLQGIMQYGCLPQVFTEPNLEIKQAFLKSYVGTYLQEEIQREARVKNLEGFARFLEFAALENGNPVNFKKIAKAIGIADTSVKAHYQLLLDTLLAYQIPAWAHSARKQVQKAAKYYFFDNGVLNALSGELQTELRPSTYRYGKLFENLVLCQMIQALDKANSPLKIYHYREYGGKEVDFILQKNAHSPCLAIEVKSQTNPKLADVKSLVSFKELFPKSTTLVICQTPRAYSEAGIGFVSLEEGIKLLVDFGEL